MIKFFWNINTTSHVFSTQCYLEDGDFVLANVILGARWELRWVGFGA